MGKGNWKCKVSVSTSDNTNTSMKIKASCVWDSNDWSYNMNGITGWVYINGHEYEVYSGSIDCSSGNTKTLGSKTVTINKTHSSQSIPCYAKIKSTSSYSSGTETSGTTNKTVSAKTSYTVSYNANGGSGAPGNQTKWYSEDLNLSSTIPTRPGYTFNGWNTNSSGTGTNYSSGAKYTSNAALILYAKWTINTYTVSYNANGGSSTPGSQTKNYGSTIYIAGEISRTGYTFGGWNGSDGVNYSAGAPYSGNYNLTLTARWTINTYTISYNANGGSGAPGNQTKTYGQNLILSSIIPTKSGYNFKGWATSQNGTVAYQPGSTYTNNSGATLWAVWELAYVKPRITNFNAYRCDSNGTADENGTYIKVEANWETDNPIRQSVTGSGIKIYWGTSESYSTVNIIYNLPTTNGSINKIIGGGNVSPEESYYVQIYVNDVTGYNETAKYPIPTASYPIDIKKYGKGIAFGGVASEENVMDVYFKAKFRQIVNAFDDIYLQDAKYLKGYDSNNNLIFLIRAYDNKTAVGDGTKETRIWSNVIPTISVGGTVYNIAVDKVLNYMAIKLSANVDVQCNSQLWSPNINVPFNAIQKSIGNGLTFVNNGIKIGTGIKQVRVSGCTMQHNLNNTPTSIVGIFHNSNILSSGYLTGKDKGFTTLCFPPVIIDVNQNDVITMKYGSDTANSTFRFAAGVYTQLVVEAI